MVTSCRRSDRLRNKSLSTTCRARPDPGRPTSDDAVIALNNDRANNAPPQSKGIVLFLPLDAIKGVPLRVVTLRSRSRPRVGLHS